MLAAPPMESATNAKVAIMPELIITAEVPLMHVFLVNLYIPSGVSNAMKRPVSAVLKARHCMRASVTTVGLCSKEVLLATAWGLFSVN